MKYFISISIFISMLISCSSCSEPEISRTDTSNGGYLFAHMTTSDYGSMYYSVSYDGVHWETLNNGAKINEYRGHPDFCTGRDGRYYMIGVEGGTWRPVLWVTGNLIGWNIEKYLPEKAFDVSKSGYFTEHIWYNAPKMYYDADSDQYIITWHPAEAKYDIPDMSETHPQYKNMWRSIRTFYILTKDFETFTEPQRLFHFTGEHENMPTMDAIIRKIDGKYRSFIKDERWDGEVSSGAKAIRMTSSDNLTGPYCNPSGAITDMWTEAQTLTCSPDGKGWYLYAEHYPLEYYMYKAETIEGPWNRVEIESPDARHGSVLRINSEQMEAIRKAYRNR